VACLRIPQRPDLLYVVTRGGAAALVAAKTNTVLQVFTPTLARTDKPLPVPEFVGGCVSAKGKYVYALASDSVVYCFDVDTAVTVAAFKAHNKEALALAQHPFHPALVTTAQDSTARVWT
jgi:WD40 repeat protein